MSFRHHHKAEPNRVFKSRLFALLTAITLMALNAAYASNERPVIRLGFNDQYSKILPGSKEFIERVYARLGYKTELIELPLVRVHRAIELGQVDALIIGGRGLNSHVKYVAETSTALKTEDIYVILNSQYKHLGNNELSDKCFAVLRGAPMHKLLTQTISSCITEVNDIEQAYTLVDRARLDGIILTETMKLRVSLLHNYVNLYSLEQPITRFHFVHLVALELSDLIPQLDEAIQAELKATGINAQ